VAGAPAAGLEKEALGFYVTGHPLGEFAGDLAKLTTASSDFEKVREGAEIRVGGLVKAVKNYTDRKGETMAFVTIEDLEGTIEVTIFSSLQDRRPLWSRTRRWSCRQGDVTEGGSRSSPTRCPIAEARERLTRACTALLTPG
jgi:DNA polymerase-3 subunit alpha